MQDRPVCFKCVNVIEHSPVWEAPCGHERCPSAVFHGLCLMEFRDQRNAAQAAKFQVIGMLVQTWTREHTEHD